MHHQILLQQSNNIDFISIISLLITCFGFAVSIVALSITLFIAIRQNQFEQIRKFRAKGIFNSPKMGITFIQEGVQAEMFAKESGNYGRHVEVYLEKKPFQIRIISHVLHKGNDNGINLKFSFTDEVFHVMTFDAQSQASTPKEGFRVEDTAADYLFNSNEIWVLDEKLHQAYYPNTIAERNEWYYFLQFSRFRKELDFCELSPDYKSKSLTLETIDRDLYLTLWSYTAYDSIDSGDTEFFILKFR